MARSSSPFVLKPASVQSVMLQVLLALVPGIAVHTWLFGPAILVQLVIASTTAVAIESAMLMLRNKPIGLHLSDLSALVTAWLIALAFPTIVPWWLMVVGVAFAVIVAKHLYGGLGQNPFNPAMVAFAVCIVSFPALMSQTPATQQPFGLQLERIFLGQPHLDSLTAATPLDTLKTGIKQHPSEGINAIVKAHPDTFGHFAGKGWEWVTFAYLIGGLWLIYRKVISWHIPLAVIVGMTGVATVLWIMDPHQFASPLFHLFAGATLLGAFFIATDPVSGASTPRGKLIFAFGIGLLAYVIRVFGGYPDGIAFAVLLMNIAAPMIDHLTQPPIFGMKGRS